MRSVQRPNKGHEGDETWQRSARTWRAFENNVGHASGAAEALDLEGLAEEGKQGGIQVDLADEGEERLCRGANGSGHFEAVDG
jgi:hypothetical protein